MFFIFGRAIIFAVIYAIVGCLALKIAYRVVFREYSLEITDAFKYMFGVGLISYLAFVVTAIATAVSGTPDTPALTGPLVAIGVNYCGTVWILMRFEGLILGQALGVSLITTGLFVLEIIALVFGLDAAGS